MEDSVSVINESLIADVNDTFSGRFVQQPLRMSSNQNHHIPPNLFLRLFFFSCLGACILGIYDKTVCYIIRGGVNAVKIEMFRGSHFHHIMAATSGGENENMNIC